MIRALIFAAGAAAGFVAGTRAGRQTYEKMKNQSLDVWHRPDVQEKVGGATQTLKEKAPQVTQTLKEKAPQVQHQVADLAKKATHRGAGTGAHAAADESVVPPTGAVLPPNDTPVPPTPEGKTDSGL